MSIQDDLVQVLFNYNIIPQYLFRDKNIRVEFNELVNSGIKARAAKTILAEKYFTSESNIARIVYSKPKKFLYEKPTPQRRGRNIY